MAGALASTSTAHSGSMVFSSVTPAYDPLVSPPPAAVAAGAGAGSERSSAVGIGGRRGLTGLPRLTELVSAAGDGSGSGAQTSIAWDPLDLPYLERFVEIAEEALRRMLRIFSLDVFVDNPAILAYEDHARASTYPEALWPYFRVRQDADGTIRYAEAHYDYVMLLAAGSELLEQYGVTLPDLLQKAEEETGIKAVSVETATSGATVAVVAAADAAPAIAGAGGEVSTVAMAAAVATVPTPAVAGAGGASGSAVSVPRAKKKLVRPLCVTPDQGLYEFLLLANDYRNPSGKEEDISAPRAFYVEDILTALNPILDGFISAVEDGGAVRDVPSFLLPKGLLSADGASVVEPLPYEDGDFTEANKAFALQTIALAKANLLQFAKQIIGDIGVLMIQKKRYQIIYYKGELPLSVGGAELFNEAQRYKLQGCLLTIETSRKTLITYLGQMLNIFENLVNNVSVRIYIEQELASHEGTAFEAAQELRAILCDDHIDFLRSVNSLINEARPRMSTVPNIGAEPPATFADFPVPDVPAENYFHLLHKLLQHLSERFKPNTADDRLELDFKEQLKCVCVALEVIAKEPRAAFVEVKRNLKDFVRGYLSSLLLFIKENKHLASKDSVAKFLKLCVVLKVVDGQGDFVMASEFEFKNILRMLGFKESSEIDAEVDRIFAAYEREASASASAVMVAEKARAWGGDLKRLRKAHVASADPVVASGVAGGAGVAGPKPSDNFARAHADLLSFLFKCLEEKLTAIEHEEVKALRVDIQNKLKEIMPENLLQKLGEILDLLVLSFERVDAATSSKIDELVEWFSQGLYLLGFNINLVDPVVDSVTNVGEKKSTLKVSEPLKKLLQEFRDKFGIPPTRLVRGFLSLLVTDPEAETRYVQGIIGEVLAALPERVRGDFSGRLLADCSLILSWIVPVQVSLNDLERSDLGGKSGGPLASDLDNRPNLRMRLGRSRCSYKDRAWVVELQRRLEEHLKLLMSPRGAKGFLLRAASSSRLSGGQSFWAGSGTPDGRGAETPAAGGAGAATAFASRAAHASGAAHPHVRRTSVVELVAVAGAAPAPAPASA